MKLAVLMSSYNGEAYIDAQIQSILAQECDMQVDIWVRDDGSTDTTPQILQKYADMGKLQWYSGPNLKPAKSFLDLVCHCPGYDFYAFADQDDYWYPDKLRSSIQLLADQTGPALSFANAHLVDGQLQSLGRNVYQRTPHGDFYSLICAGGILGCTAAFNRQLAELIRKYSQPEQLIMHDSYCAILCALFDGNVLFDPQPHMDYRQHGNNVLGTQWTKWAALKNRLRRITVPERISIADMAQSLLAQAPDAQDPDKMAFLKQVATYRKSVLSALRLAGSRKPQYNSKNMAITMRLAIALRNR